LLVYLLSEDVDRDRIGFEHFRRGRWNTMPDAAKFAVGADTYFDLPPLPLAASTDEGCRALLTQVLSLMDNWAIEQTVIVVDGALYARLSKFVNTDPDLRQRIVLKLGDFHLRQVFHAAILAYLKDSGLVDLLVESGAFTSVESAERAMAGGHYKRATLGYSMLFTTVSRRLWCLFEDEVKRAASSQDTKSESFPSLTATEILEQIAEVKSPVPAQDHSASATLADIYAARSAKGRILGLTFDTWLAKAETTSGRVKYLAVLFRALCVLQDFDAVTKCPVGYGGLASFINVEARMLPLLEIFNHTLYCRLLAAEIATLSTLDRHFPIVFAWAESGAHLCVRVESTCGGEPYSGVPVDMSLEHM